MIYLVRRMNDEKKIQAVINLAEGIQYLHSQEDPIVHSKLKHENILVDEVSNLKINFYSKIILLLK